jgi:hypothetical protein
MALSSDWIGLCQRLGEQAANMAVSVCVNFLAVLGLFTHESAGTGEDKIARSLICLVFRSKACIAYSPIWGAHHAVTY